MTDYNKALECLNYLVQFIREIKNPSVGATNVMFNKDGEIIMRTDLGYWEKGNADLRSYLMKRVTEAIPIEWIEEWGWKNGMSESMSLRVMIEDWEREKNG